MHNKEIGLGDIAYVAFRPIVYIIDFVWGTDLKDCDVCKGRRAKWNKIVSMPAWMWAAILATTIVLCLTIKRF